MGKTREGCAGRPRLSVIVPVKAARVCWLRDLELVCLATIVEFGHQIPVIRRIFAEHQVSRSSGVRVFADVSELMGYQKRDMGMGAGL